MLLFNDGLVDTYGGLRRVALKIRTQVESALCPLVLDDPRTAGSPPPSSPTVEEKNLGDHNTAPKYIRFSSGYRSRRCRFKFTFILSTILKPAYFERITSTMWI